MNEEQELKELINRRESEQKAYLDAKRRLAEIEIEKKEKAIRDEQERKLAEEKKIRDSVLPDLSPVYVKNGRHFFEATRFWMTAHHECWGCGVDPDNGKMVFFKIRGSIDPVFVENYAPKG